MATHPYRAHYRAEAEAIIAAHEEAKRHAPRAHALVRDIYEFLYGGTPASMQVSRAEGEWLEFTSYQVSDCGRINGDQRNGEIAIELEMAIRSRLANIVAAATRRAEK